MRPLVAGTDRPLATVHDTALLDLDGVLYVGADAVPGAAEAVAAAREAGMSAAFVTNNAARTPQTVAAHLVELGIPADPADVITSAQAAATLVRDLVPPGSAVLVVGGEGLDSALLEEGLRPVRTAAEQPSAVVQGFSPDVGWRLLAEGTYAVRAGLPWVASNLDSTVPTPQGLAPGNGTLVGVIAAATGRRPVSAGKPETPLHDEAVRRSGARSPLVVGDRLDTDIEGGNRAGVASLLVLTGVATPADLVAAPPPLRPTYLARDLRDGLLRAHPPVQATGSGWTCGGWTARAEQGRLHLGRDVAQRDEPDGLDGLDGLRALCVAAWEADIVPDAAHVRQLLAGLDLDLTLAR